MKECGHKSSEHIGPIVPLTYLCECCGKQVIDCSDPVYCSGADVPTGCDMVTGFCGKHHAPLVDGKCTFNALLAKFRESFA